jgi:hypothetical protein
MIHMLDTVHLPGLVIKAKPLGNSFSFPSAGGNRNLLSLGPLEGLITTDGQRPKTFTRCDLILDTAVVSITLYFY